MLLFLPTKIFSIPSSTITETILPSHLEEFESNSLPVKNLIEKALKLANMHLGYLYGSADPQNGGMDCSGTIYYLLKEFLEDVPRQSDEIYTWVWQKGDFIAVNGSDFNSFEFAKLKPGDLLFWSGTYPTTRKIPVTHVMLYLGKTSKTSPIMFGSSDGRTYHNKQMYGVSVFDFKLPDKNAKSRFLGYSCIPGLTCVKGLHISKLPQKKP